MTTPLTRRTAPDLCSFGGRCLRLRCTWLTGGCRHGLDLDELFPIAEERHAEEGAPCAAEST
jgi:hypothetical protein